MPRYLDYAPNTIPFASDDTTVWFCGEGHERCMCTRPIYDHRGCLIRNTRYANNTRAPQLVLAVVQAIHEAEVQEQQRAEMLRRRQEIMESIENDGGTGFPTLAEAMRFAGSGGRVQNMDNNRIYEVHRRGMHYLRRFFPSSGRLSTSWYTVWDLTVRVHGNPVWRVVSLGVDATARVSHAV